MVVDWGQTRYIAKHPEYREVWVGRALGEHPSLAKVNSWFAGGVLLQGVTSYWLPRPYREGFQYVSIGFELNAVLHNRSIGIGVSFPFR